jgi:hypothetical protein
MSGLNSDCKRNTASALHNMTRCSLRKPDGAQFAINQKRQQRTAQFVGYRSITTTQRARFAHYFAARVM